MLYRLAAVALRMQYPSCRRTALYKLDAKKRINSEFTSRVYKTKPWGQRIFATIQPRIQHFAGNPEMGVQLLANSDPLTGETTNCVRSIRRSRLNLCCHRQSVPR
ncbi:MAG TPA: hypothetical protein DDW52_07335 [Planctomycetaceae bacterium]|nr:hypothetical protein [Planctomycetaceae bacterium]